MFSKIFASVVGITTGASSATMLSARGVVLGTETSETVIVLGISMVISSSRVVALTLFSKIFASVVGITTGASSATILSARGVV